jgi:hypothetical protein
MRQFPAAPAVEIGFGDLVRRIDWHEFFYSLIIALKLRCEDHIVFPELWGVRVVYPVGRDGEWEDMAETISYLLAELER